MLVFCSSQIGWRRYQLVSDSLQKFFLVGIDQRMSEQRHEVICHDNEIPTCLCCPEVICDKVIDGEIILQFFYPKSVIRKWQETFSNDRFGIITPIILNKMMLSLLFQNKVLHLQRLTRCQCKIYWQGWIENLAMLKALYGLRREDIYT